MDRSVSSSVRQKLLGQERELLNVGEHKQRGRIGAEGGSKGGSWRVLLGVLVLVASAVTFAGCSADSSGVGEFYRSVHAAAA